MKLSCIQENLNKGINIVNRLIGPRTTLPVLGNILLKAEDGKLILSATDLEIGISTSVRAKIEKSGSITIPARLLSEFITNNNDKNIDIELKNDTDLHLKSDRYNVLIKGISASEFPLIPKVKEKPIALINSLTFKEGIEQTVFSTSNDETKAILMGEYLLFSNDKLKIVATDSYRLAEKTIDLKTPVKEDQSVIIPSRTMSELARIISGENNEITISIGDNQILFKSGDTELVSRIIEGEFPNYEQIIPINSSFSLEIDAREFMNAVKMASFFARDDSNNIKLKITKNDFHIDAASPQVGSSVSKLKVENNNQSKEISIAFNAKFIQDALSIIKSEKVLLELEGKLNPGIIKPLNKKDYLYVIMPLHLDEEEEKK